MVRPLQRHELERRWLFTVTERGVRTPEEGTMERIIERLRDAAVIAAVAVTVALMTGCEKGPVQKAGERVDRALDQEPVIGKGPVERAGKKVDKAVDEVKR
jgi:hypothetical protein